MEFLLSFLIHHSRGNQLSGGVRKCHLLSQATSDELPWASKILRAACLKYSWNSSENWNDNFNVVIFCRPEVREFFNLDNPRNAETNDDDDQPGADESDTQVTNNMTQFGCIQQALPSYIVLIALLWAILALCTHLYGCCTPFTSCKVPHFTLPELTPLFVGAKKLWWIPPQNKRCINVSAIIQHLPI